MSLDGEEVKAAGATSRWCCRSPPLWVAGKGQRCEQSERWETTKQADEREETASTVENVTVALKLPGAPQLEFLLMDGNSFCHWPMEPERRHAGRHMRQG